MSSKNLLTLSTPFYIYIIRYNVYISQAFYCLFLTVFNIALSSALVS